MKPNQVRINFTFAARHLLTIAGAFALLLVAPAFGQNPELQEKISAVKQNVAENKMKLHQYQWTETTQLTLKGDPKPPSTNLCQYGPDGTVQKTLVSPPPEQPSGGRMKKRVIAKKKEEMKDYMGDVKVLLAKYVPPDPQSMQQAFQSGKVSLSPNPGSGVTQMVFKDYALPGDQMTLSFDSAAKKISTVKVDTYLDDPKDVVTLAVKFASLPDSTNYVQQTVLDATAKKMVVTTTNSDYKAIGR